MCFQKPCELCGKLGWGHVVRTEGGNYRKCLYCGSEKQVLDSVFNAKQRFAREQEMYYDEYSLCLSPLLRFLHRHQVKSRFRFLHRYVTKGRLLEVGPGMGDFMLMAKAEGYEIEGVEASSVFAEKIRENCSSVVYQGTFEEVEIKGGQYDAWISFHVIEHLIDPVAHLLKAFEVVRPGGYAFIATPNGGSWEHRIARSWSPNYSTAHVHVFSAQGIWAALERSGWEVVQSKTLSNGVSWLRVLISCARHLRGSSGRLAQRGALAQNVSARTGRLFLDLYWLIFWPLHTLQAALGGGNELLVVARRNT